VKRLALQQLICFTHIIKRKMALHLNWNKEKSSMAAKKKVRESDKKQVPQDTTEYLLSDPANKARLLRAVDDLKNGKLNIHERKLIEE
jgi:hypothetical protein